MTKYLCSLFVFALVFFSTLFHSPVQAHAANLHDVVFYEIMWPGSAASTADEWLVLKNTTSADIDLTDWQITYWSDSEKKMLDFSEEPKRTILANGYFLISNNSADHQFSGAKSSVLNIAPDMIDASVSLSNSDLQLKLYDGDFALSANLIDTAGAVDEAPFAGSNTTPKSSMVRNELIGDGALAISWHTNTAQCNLDAGATELATPQSSIEDTKCHPPKLTLANNFPSFLKIGEVFTTSFSVIDAGDLDAVVVTATGSTINNQSLILQCNSVGTQQASIIATDSKGSKDQKIGTVQCYDSGAVVINEVMPTPKATDYDQSGTIDTKDEWIELYNPESRPINLAGWSMGDKINPKKYPFGVDAIIAPNGFLTVTHRQSGIALNDDDEEVFLYDPSGLLIDKVVYDKGHDDAGWARFDTGFEWTLAPTYNSQNIKSPIDQDMGGVGGPTLSDEKPSSSSGKNNLAAEVPAKPMEIVKYKVTTTKTTKPPSYASLPTRYLPQVPVAKIFERADSLAKSVNRDVVPQMIVGLVGLFSLARVSYNVLCLLL